MKFIVYLLLLMLPQVTAFSQTEMKYWSLPPYKVNFTGASPTKSTPALLNGPSAVYYDGSGLYFTDQMNHSVRTSYDDVSGNGVPGYVDYNSGRYSEYNQPAGIVKDASGNIYVADKMNNVIRIINSSNIVSTFAGSGTAGYANGTGTAAQFNQPEGLFIDGSGNIYVADNGNHMIRKITTSGVVTTIAGNSFGLPGLVDGTGSGASFRNPSALTRDASGNLYVADYGNNCIRKITTAGVVTTIAGSTSATAGFVNATGTSARFNGPFGITLDGSGNLYVSEKNNHTIRKVTTSFVVTTLAGSGTPGILNGVGTGAYFCQPAGLTYDGFSNIIVADYGNNILRNVTTAGVVTSYSTSPSAYAVSNSAYDANGNVLFSVKNDFIINATGATVGRLTNNGALDNVADLGNDIEIVPVPGTCRDFYIIYCLGTGTSTTNLRYSTVSLSVSGVVTLVSDGLLIGGSGGNFVATAVSLLNTGTNTRFLYAVASGALYKHTITSTGINAGPSILSLTSGVGDAHDLDLSPDGNTLAWSSPIGSGSTATINFVSPNAGFIALTTKTISIGSYTGCHGVEFSADNASLYLSLNSSVTANQGIYKMNISTGTSAMVSGTSGHYGTTQLEIAGDGYLYAIDGNSSPAGLLGRISTSDVLTNSLLSSTPILSNLGTNATFDLYRLPDQIHGQSYSYFFGVAKPNATFTINGAATSPTVAVNTYTCSTITLGNTASAATAYSITVTSSDASGNVVSGYNYPTGLISAVPPATIDIKALNSNYLLTHPGYFLITFYAQNACVNTTYTALIQNSTLTNASANFLFSDGTGASYPPAALPGTLGCTGGVAVNGSNSTGYIDTYQIRVDKVDPTTGALITANIVNTTPTTVPAGNPANIVGVSLNTKSSPKNYFITNTGTFKITYTVTNACGSTNQPGYFIVDGSCRLGKDDVVQTYKQGAAYPNPSNGITNVSFNSKEVTEVKLTLTPMQGHDAYTVLDKHLTVQGENIVSFDTATLPAGIYLYQISDVNNTIQTGKLVVTK